MTQVSDFAILAPVPLEHLRSGEEIARRTGFVAFGSRKWELFRKVEEMRAGAPVPVLIYPSHEDVPATESFVVSWAGWYIGSEETSLGRHSKDMTHRPPTTSTDTQGHWAVFWHVCDIFELPKAQWRPISAVETVKGGWRKNAPPRGPELVASPSKVDLFR